jgi:hypothetical protein
LRGKLIGKMCRALTPTRLVETALGPQVNDGLVLRVTVHRDPDKGHCVPMLIIDGRKISWDMFGRMVATFEGRQFRLALRVRGEAVWPVRSREPVRPSLAEAPERKRTNLHEACDYPCIAVPIAVQRRRGLLAQPSARRITPRDVPVGADRGEQRFELAVATAISLFGFEYGAALATVVGVLIEVPLMLLVVRWVNRSQAWYEAGVGR